LQNKVVAIVWVEVRVWVNKIVVQALIDKEADTTNSKEAEAKVDKEAEDKVVQALVKVNLEVDTNDKIAELMMRI